MKQKQKGLNGLILVSLGCSFVLTTPHFIEASQPSSVHLGTFEGRTTFIATSSSQVTPELVVEVIDDNGNSTQYQSKDGVIALSDTQEGTYVTQAQLLGQTFYIDQETGDRFETFEENRTLKLESVENPGLKILSEEHFNHMDLEKGTISGAEGEDANASVSGETVRARTKGMRRLNGSKRVLFSENLEGIPKFLFSYDGDGNYLGRTPEGWEKGTEIEAKEGAVYYRVAFAKYLEDIPKTMYIIPEGHDVSEISSVESFSLSKLNDKQDCFNLKTGELTKKNGLIQVTDEMINKFTDYGGFISNFHLVFDEAEARVTTTFGPNYKPMISDKMYAKGWNETTPEHIVSFSQYSGTMRTYCGSKGMSLDEWKQWFKENKPILIYELATPTTKIKDLKTNHRFTLLNKSFIQLKGEISPVITSIAVPSEELTFTLDPNQEAGQRFIAPEFEVINGSNAPLTLTLKNFEQTTDVLNDVLPSEYDSWDGLTKEGSKDIALGLVSKSSTDWLSHVDETCWVTESTNKELGTIKPKGTVGFGFIAHHGQAFSEVLNPSYKLIFVFDLLN